MSAVFKIKLALSACDFFSHGTGLLFQSNQHEVYLHVSDSTLDQSTYTLFIDGNNICSSTSIDKAFRLLFLASYVFNLVVPKTMRCTVAFVSKLACAIDNSTGQDKVLKTAQNKCMTLIEKLAKFNGTIRQRKSRQCEVSGEMTDQDQPARHSDGSPDYSYRPESPATADHSSLRESPAAAMQTSRQQPARRHYPAKSARRTPDHSSHRECSVKSACRTRESPDHSSRCESPAAVQTSRQQSARRESPAKSACRTRESPDHSSRHESPAAVQTSRQQSARRESPAKSARRESPDHLSHRESPVAAAETSRLQSARRESQVPLSRKSTIKPRKRNDCRLTAAKKTQNLMIMFFTEEGR